MIHLKQQTNIKKTPFNTDKKYQKVSFLLILVVILPVILNLKNNIQSSPYISSLYWGAFIIIAGLFIPFIHTGKIQNQILVKSYAISGATMYIVFTFIAGVLGKTLKATPYDISPLGILINIITIFPPLIAKEFIRHYLIGTAKKTMKYKFLAIVLITLLISITQINFFKIEQIKDTESLIIYIISDIGIVLARNILMSTLAYYGNFSYPIIYLSIIELFQKCFPFLPELSWLINGSIGIAFPIIYSMIISENLKIEIEHRKIENPKANILYIISLCLSVMFSWFCVGVFNIYPSIILTGSMEPGIYPGDVVLIKKMLKEEDIYNLKKGDIINFQKEDINITHRIEKIQEDEAGNLSFTTKGDNNKSIDNDMVLPNDINGIIINKIPKIGVPLLLIKSGEIPEGVIDYDK